VNRNPPDEVKRILRAEVGFGCPLSYCRKPFLTFHHFDPPWEERHHHEPAGMIALCPEHHHKADRKVFTRAALRLLKTNPITADTVKGKFEWTATSHLVRLGGNYTDNVGTVLVLNGEDVIKFSKGAELDAELSFVLRDSSGLIVSEMRNNMLEVTEAKNLYDLDVRVSGTGIKFRDKKRSVLLDLLFKRVSVDGLRKTLKEDALRSTDPDGGAEVSGCDAITSQIMTWANDHLDGDGNVSLLDFRNMTLYYGGKVVNIRNGFEFGFDGMRCHFNCFWGGVGFK
jgi:hypothetical protein